MSTSTCLLVKVDTRLTRHSGSPSTGSTSTRSTRSTIVTRLTRHPRSPSTGSTRSTIVRAVVNIFTYLAVALSFQSLHGLIVIDVVATELFETLVDCTLAILYADAATLLLV